MQRSVSFSREAAVKAGAIFFKDTVTEEEDYLEDEEPDFELFEFFYIKELPYSIEVFGEDTVHIINIRLESSYNTIVSWLDKNDIEWDFA